MLFLAGQKESVLHVQRFFFGNQDNQERLPFVWKTRKFRGEFKWNGFILVEIFREKSNTFRGITFFPFLAKQPKFSVPFVWITSTRLQVERKRKIYRYFVNGTLNPVPVFGPKKKKIPVPFDGNFHQISVQMVSAPFWLFSLPSPLGVTRFYILFSQLQILTRASLLALAKSIYQITIQGHFAIGQRQKLMT